MMSSLGIRFALPYKGSNGIIVESGTIKINPVDTIYFFNGVDFGSSDLKTKIDYNGVSIQQASGGTNENTLVLSANNIEGKDILNTTVFNLSSQQLQLTDNVTGNNSTINATTVTIEDQSGKKAILEFFRLLFNTVSLNDPDGLGTSVDTLTYVVGETTGTVIPSTTKYIALAIGGIEYKVIIAQ